MTPANSACTPCVKGTLLALLRGQDRRARRRRVLVRAGALGRWFAYASRSRRTVGLLHPQRAALAQFIKDIDASAPDAELVADDLVEALYDFGAGGKATGDFRPNAPMVLMIAHRAKGLEFDHVLILDSGGWLGEGRWRRLIYVGMTRARKSLTPYASVLEASTPSFATRMG